MTKFNVEILNDVSKGPAAAVQIVSKACLQFTPFANGNENFRLYMSGLEIILRFTYISSNFIASFLFRWYFVLYFLKFKVIR